MQNSCISTRSFEDKHTIYTKSKPVEIFMGSNAEHVIDRLLQNFQNAHETSNERETEFLRDSAELLYHFHGIDIRRAESYIMSPDWIANEKAAINPKNEKDKCFQWSKLQDKIIRLKKKN